MTDQSLPCSDRALALHAAADGELDALAVAALEDHLRGCAGCRGEMERIEALRTVLADLALRQSPPDGLRQRVLAATGSAEPRIPESSVRKLGPWLGGGAIGAIAASLALFLAIPEVAEPGLAGALVDGQIRSLQSGRLVDVLTSDRHTVKPWFNGRITFAPPVVDLKDQGFTLVGGRLDVVAQQSVAVLVYRRRLHTINLFIRPLPSLASPLAGHGSRAGYNLLRWSGGGLEFWAVSDVEPTGLDEFRQSFVRATVSAHES